MSAPLAVAQNTQIGATIGRGGAAQLLEDSAYHFVEGCVRCGGRLGLYLEYNHWKKTGAGTGNPTSLDLAGGGLRIQGKGRRVRPGWLPLLTPPPGFALRAAIFGSGSGFPP